MKKSFLPLVFATLLLTACGGKAPLPVIPGGGNNETPDKPIEQTTAVLSWTPENLDADSPCTIFFNPGKDSSISSELYDITDDLYAHIGIFYDEDWAYVQAQWDENTTKCRMTRTGDNSYELHLEPSIREFFNSGATPIETIALVIRNSDGSLQTRPDQFIPVTDKLYKNETFDPQVVSAAMPEGLKHGINYGENSVTFVLYDKTKSGKRHDYACIIGDFNEWKRSEDYLMKWDEDAGCWWYTLEGVEAGKEHMFQYYIGDGASAIRIFDATSEIVLDPWNDKYISSSTYADMPAYPAAAKDLVGAFQINRPQYDWQVPQFRIEDKDDLIIYEMHLRDFSTSGDIAGALEHLDYLKNLGVNAIELMPVQEFDGNDSWGYNPYAYYALDKAYGTREDYCRFIDECHKAGIAVILDVVYNHATGSHPYAKLWWDSAKNNVSSENPYFNVTTPHPFGVFHDWNHESILTREHIAGSLEYLLTQYKIDGFRFDLTKGFTNESSNESTAGNYDKSRIDNLTYYWERIHAANPDAVMICEHFCSDKEEKELAAAGMKLWRNCNNAFCQSAMGYAQDSSFEALWTGTNGMSFGGYVGFAESHDEERNAYKAMTYGISGVKDDLDGTCRRLELNAAFLLLTPGPKMIWQFGELAYDYSIEYNDRTGRKPIHWEYFDNSSRRRLYDTCAELMSFRRGNPEFFDSTAAFSWKVGQSAWNCRSISCSCDGKEFTLVGNFSAQSQSVEVEFNGTTETIELASGQYRLLTNF